MSEPFNAREVAGLDAANYRYPRNGRVGGPNRAHPSPIVELSAGLSRRDFVAAIREHPGSWAAFGKRYPRLADSARKSAYDFKRRYPGIEATTVTLGDETIVYARAQPDRNATTQGVA